DRRCRAPPLAAVIALNRGQRILCELEMGDNSASCGARYHLATTPDAAGVEPARRHGQEVHGLYRLRRGVEELGKRGLRPVRGNTQLGRALARWRGQLIRDLGGDPCTAQVALVDLA